MRAVLSGYCRALAGRRLDVAPCARLVRKNIGWVRDDVPTSDGTTIYLPGSIHGQDEQECFSTYKVMATHQVGHTEWRTFDLVYDPPSQPSGEPGSVADRSAFTRFFTRFPLQILARDIFAVAEGYRVDSRILAGYPGLGPCYERIQHSSLGERPALATLPPREAIVETIVRASLGEEAAHAGVTAEAVRLLRDLRHPEATVEAAARATMRIYAVVVDRADGVSEDQGAYHPAARVAYRGELKPELAQILSRTADASGSRACSSPGRASLEELVQGSPEVEIAPGETPEPLRRREVLDALEAELAESAAPSPGEDMDPDEDDADDGPLEATGPGTFVYDEWDAGQERYRERHCLVRERPAPARDTHFFEETLRRHGTLARSIRRQFEAIAAQTDRRQQRLEDGEDYDLDAAVDALVERRGGRSPSDKLFWRRSKRERSVAVALLLDLSASTANPVAGQENVGTGTQRIIDLEKEALVLLVHALGLLGDACGVYGFSGYTRRNAEFYVMKDLDEPLSREVYRRIGCIEPRSATRMGPAIRHTAAKLGECPARSKYLFLISDGRPQDRGYGGPGESRQYAAQDTRAALLSARRQGITPFCLTVDKEGQADLAAMMRDMSYEVLWDIQMLPRRLPELYRLLTG